jgi:hypothetical protein
MSQLQDRIERFRRSLRHDADLESIANVFHETLASHDDFIAASRPHDDARLRLVMEGLLGRAFGGDATLEEARLLRIGEARFAHGSASALVCGRGVRQRVLAIVSYCEVGRIGLCIAIDAAMRARFMRFRVEPEVAAIRVPARGSA